MIGFVPKNVLTNWGNKVKGTADEARNRYYDNYNGEYDMKPDKFDEQLNDGDRKYHIREEEIDKKSFIFILYLLISPL